jgi:hypothetical protein
MVDADRIEQYHYGTIADEAYSILTECTNNGYIDFS